MLYKLDSTHRLNLLGCLVIISSIPLLPLYFQHFSFISNMLSMSQVLFIFWSDYKVKVDFHKNSNWNREIKKFWLQVPI